MRIRVCLTGLLLLAVMAVEGEIFNTGRVLNAGIYTVNLEGQFDFGAEKMMMLTHFETGLINYRNDIGITLGMVDGGDEFYYAADVEFALIDEFPALSVAVGLHSQEDMGLDTTLLVSHEFSQTEPYAGLDMNYEFSDPDDIYFLNLVIGVEVKFSYTTLEEEIYRFGFIIEGASQLQATDELDHSYISAGAIYYF